MEPPIVWNETFTVGHDALDTEHRAIVDAINAVCALDETQRPTADMETRLTALRRAVEDHLRSESAVLWELSTGTTERLRKLRQNPRFQELLDAAKLVEHFADHDRTLAEIDAIIASARAAGSNGAGSACVPLRTWFLEHSINYDAHLKAIFRAM
jgi:hemerythrin